MKIVLWPLSILYSAIMQLRNWLYDQGWLKVHRFQVPIVSVGNLTWGGTGKTPILCELIQWSLSQNLKPVVISRGYRGQVKGVERVKTDGDPALFGDEPVMIAKRFLQVPVYVGADRVSVVNEVLKLESGVQIVFADDAFQHRRLGRDIDVVILDSVEKIKNYCVAPLGRAREDFSGLKRADYLILNKVNLVDPHLKQEKLDFIERHLRELRHAPPLIECEYYIKALSCLSDFDSVRASGQKEIVDDKLLGGLNSSAESAMTQQNVLMVSAIGNPKTFERLLEQKFQIKKHLIYRDHHAYTLADVNSMIAEAQKLKVSKILVTEKDAVKIALITDRKDLFWVVQLAPKLSLRVKQLYEGLRQLTS